MRTVFLSDISVACSSKSVWVSDEATSTRVPLASGAFSAPLLLASLGASSSFEVVAGAGLSEARTEAKAEAEAEAEVDAACELTLEVRRRPPVRDRLWTMVLRRLSSPSISFLPDKQKETVLKRDREVYGYREVYNLCQCFVHL